MRAAPSPQAALDIVADDKQAMADPDISQAVETAGATPENRERIESMLDLRALTEQPTKGPGAASQEAKSIKASPMYSDAGVRESNKWLSSALERLKNLRFDPKLPQGKQPDLAGGGRWIVNLMWCLLALGVLFLAYLAFRHLDWKTKLGRRAKAVLEEDEPERSLDEWLEQADALAAKGAYREAVRALYLACLLRFDEHRVARFDRHETNWEHLARIHRSTRRPEDLDFTPPTKAFDRIWYGKQVEGISDVNRFREWYQTITETLKKVAA